MAIRFRRPLTAIWSTGCETARQDRHCSVRHAAISNDALLGDAAMNSKQVRKFEAWLNSRGADVLATTSEWELCRFSCSFGVGVVYRSKKGVVSYSSEKARQTVECWRDNKAWEYGGPRVKNKGGKKPQLISRDGHACFYCGLSFDSADMTVEHILSRTHGGPDKLANMALSCRPCNEAAGSMTVVAKIAFRDSVRGARS